MISAIILAAGLSSRFGSPKPLARLGQQVVIERIQQTLIHSSVAEIIVVLGAAANAIKPFLLKHIKVKVVYNKDYKLGQTVSFQTGLKAADPLAQGLMLFPVDYPRVQPPTVDALCAFFLKHQPKVLIPSFLDRRGHPPIFHSSLRSDLIGLTPDEGLNQIAARYAKEMVLLATEDPGVVQTFNTVDEFRALF